MYIILHCLTKPDVGELNEHSLNFQCSWDYGDNIKIRSTFSCNFSITLILHMPSGGLL